MNERRDECNHQEHDYSEVIDVDPDIDRKRRDLVRADATMEKR